MGQAIVKCAPDRDPYLIWSSVVDNAIWVGTREETLAMLNEDYDRQALASLPDRANNPHVRMTRADTTGTSMIDPPVYGWDQEVLWLMEGAPPRPDGPAGHWIIRRDRLAAYAEALLAEDEAAGFVLMEWEPWEDEDD